MSEDKENDKPELRLQKPAEHWFKSPDVADAQTSSANQIAKIESTRTNASDGSLRHYIPQDQEQSIEIDFGDKTISRQNKLTEREALLAKAELAENSTTIELDSISKDQNLPEDKRALASNLQEMRSASKALGLNTDSLDAFVKESLGAGPGNPPKATETPGSLTIRGHEYGRDELLASAGTAPDVVSDATNATATNPKETLAPPTPTILHGSVSRNIHLPPAAQKPNERITGVPEDPNKGALTDPAPEPKFEDGVLFHPAPEIDPWKDICTYPAPEMPENNGALIHTIPDIAIDNGVLIHPAPDKDTMLTEVFSSKPEGDKPAEEDATQESEKPRRRKPDAPEEVIEALKKELLEMDLIKDGEIPKERGQEAAELIRSRLWAYIEDPNRRNIAFFIVEIDGQQDIAIGISGEQGPGAKVQEERPLEGRVGDAENKALNELYQKLIPSTDNVVIAGYSEQKPCESCNKVLEIRLPKKLHEDGYSFQIGKTSWTFKNEKERVGYARNKMAKPGRQWNNW